MFNDNKNQLDDFFGLKQEESPEKTGNPGEPAVTKPSLKTRLRLLSGILSFRERYLVFALLCVATVSAAVIPFTSYFHFTEPTPDYGGTVIEGIVGEPHFINPLLSVSNDADRDLQALIYSGLLKHNKDGQLVPDLARSYEISEDGLSYTVYLKENIFWHDGSPLTAEDVVFTIQTAQNPDYSSPQRVNWQGVDIELVNDRTIIFKLKNKYGQFLNTLTTGIIPKHIWQDIKPINFNLAESNLKPVGSGPFAFKKFIKDNLGKIISYELESYKKFHDGRPYIDKVEIKFYPSEDEMIEAFNSGEITGLGFISADNLDKIKFKKRLSVRDIRLPRYFMLFFNQNQSKILSDKNVRLAFNYAVDRNRLINDILNGKGIEVHEAFPKELFGSSGGGAAFPHDPDKARKLLEDAGWADIGDDGIRLGKSAGKDQPAPRLTLKLTTSAWPQLNELANILKEELKAVGVELVIDIPPLSRLQQAIKERDYEILLFGEFFHIEPDPLPLWHSSQKRDPGQNLALYDNANADKLLDEARQTLSPLQRMQKYTELQSLITQDVPVAFIYSDFYLYGLSTSIKGFEASIIPTPSDRFDGISKWYINTSRAWKK